MSEAKQQKPDEFNVLLKQIKRAVAAEKQVEQLQYEIERLNKSNKFLRRCKRYVVYNPNTLAPEIVLWIDQCAKPS